MILTIDTYLYRPPQGGSQVIENKKVFADDDVKGVQDFIDNAHGKVSITRL